MDRHRADGFKADGFKVGGLRPVSGNRLGAWFGVFPAIVFILSVLISQTALGDEILLPLTVGDAVRMALENNLKVRVAGYDRDVSEADVTVLKGEFDPSLNATVSEDFSRRSTASMLQNSEERINRYDFSLGGKVLTGTGYEFKWTNQRDMADSTFLSINPYYASEAALTLTQPLLKGFGTDTQGARIESAKSTWERYRFEYDERVVTMAAETARAYWDIVTASNRLEVSVKALDLAGKVHDEVRAKIETGAMAAVEIYSVEAEVATKEEALLNAQKMLENAQDKLKSIMNLKELSTRIEAVSAPPAPTEIPSEESVAEAALKNRKDYLKLYAERAGRETLAAYFKNQRLPQLDVFGKYGLNGLGAQYEDAINEMDPKDRYSWQMGIKLTVPLGNRAAKGNYNKARYEFLRIEALIEDARRNVIMESREAVRSLQYAQKRIAAVHKTLIAAQKRFEAEQERFKAGITTLNDALRFQNEYVSALFEEKKALADHAQALVELRRVQGELP
jgi:outer membrane protein TolC